MVTLSQLGGLQMSEKGNERAIMKEKTELRKRTVRKIREQGGSSCKLFWPDLRGWRERRLRRMKDDDEECC